MGVQLLMPVKPNIYFKFWVFFHLCRTWGPAKYQNKCNFYNPSRSVVSLGEIRLVEKGYILADLM